MRSAAIFSRTAQASSLMVALLSSCIVSAEPFDPARCRLVVETRLKSDFTEQAWQLEKNYYPSLKFDRSGDLDLLDKYLKQNGYFSAATDPDDPKSKNIVIYSSIGTDEWRREMAKPPVLSKVACEASYVSGAKLMSVWVMSGMEPAFRVEFR